MGKYHKSYFKTFFFFFTFDSNDQWFKKKKTRLIGPICIWNWIFIYLLKFRCFSPSLTSVMFVHIGPIYYDLCSKKSKLYEHCRLLCFTLHTFSFPSNTRHDQSWQSSMKRKKPSWNETTRLSLHFERKYIQLSRYQQSFWRAGQTWSTESSIFEWKTYYTFNSKYGYAWGQSVRIFLIYLMNV